MPRHRLRTFTLWTGMTLCVLIAAAFAASGWWYLRVGIRGGPFIGVVAGALEYWFPSGVTWFAGCEPHGAGLRFALVGMTKGGGFTLPLVYVFAAVAVPTLLVWRFVPRFPRGHCQRCGYKLTGSTSGRCSECGEDLLAEVKAVTGKKPTLD